jgi:DNA-binding GntR family transcriptional regulator
MSKPRPVPSSTDEAIYEKIFDAISQHYLAPGTKLAEEALGEVFGVSRTLIHSAIIRLAHDGIVDLQPNRGAFVARPSVQTTRNCFAVRRMLECAMATEIAESSLGSRGLRGVREVVKAEQAARKRGDGREQLRLSGEFHLQLAKLTGNDVLHDVLKDLISRTSLATLVYQTPGTSGCRCDDHALLIDALAAGDGVRAAATMDQHLSALLSGLNLNTEEAPSDLKTVFRQLDMARLSVSQAPRI